MGSVILSRHMKTNTAYTETAWMTETRAAIAQPARRIFDIIRNGRFINAGLEVTRASFSTHFRGQKIAQINAEIQDCTSEEQIAAIFAKYAA